MDKNCYYHRAILQVLCLIMMTTTSAYAQPPSLIKWQPLIGLSLGGAMTKKLVNSKTFPIINPAEDEYYIYQPKNRLQSRLMYEALLGVETQLRSSWSLQEALVFNQSNAYTAKGKLVQGTDPGSQDQYSYQFQNITRQILAQTKILYKYKNKYYIYALFGLGMASNKTYNYSTSVPFFLTFTREYAPHQTNSFTYNLGFGVAVAATKNIRIGLDYRFADRGKLNLGSATINQVLVPGTLAKSHLYTNELMLNLNYMI
jgi:opacity protein-like surface antigen